MVVKADLALTEAEEQMAFVQWCRFNNIICHHSGNEVGGSTRALKLRAIKMKKMGTSKGFPDLLVLIPIKGIDLILHNLHFQKELRLQKMHLKVAQ